MRLSWFAKAPALPHQNLLRVEATEEFNQFCDNTDPSGLIALSEAGAVIAVDVFVEEDIVLPLGIGLEFLRTDIVQPA